MRIVQASEPPAEAEQQPLPDAVLDAFAPGGPLARRVEAFEPRPAQLRMAKAVATLFESGGVLLAEAGTGTGKTLAYLVPAVLSRKPVLISTGTKNLQEQIFYKDVPLLRETLGVPFTATCMKGRGNYLCLHRFDAQRDAPGLFPHSEAWTLRLIEEWARTTETGDRAEIEDLPEDWPFWKEIAATSENCIGTDCPRFDECFVTRMRQRAAQSDLVIVNHHLLCADAAVRQSAHGAVIPAARIAVVDEAHQLEDVATQYFGVSVSTYRCEDLVRDVRTLVKAGQVPERDSARRLDDDADRLRDAAADFFYALERLRADLPGAEGSVRVKSGDLARLVEESAALLAALDALVADVALARDIPQDVLAIGRRGTELRDDLQFLLRADADGFVFHLEVRRRPGGAGGGVFLRASPIDVSEIVRRLLFDPLHATVLTSATLTVDGTFEYVRGRLGVHDAGEIRLLSEFDYARQSILYLPRRMPDPRSAGFPSGAAREIVEILRRTEGRAFVLFTSYATLRQVQAAAAAELPFPLLVQGTAPRSALLRDFKATPHAVLLATASFWQGVDVVGDALSCVIIDKLPFASPADPVTAARIDAIAARGGSPFGEYQVPLAVLSLLQGLGRLLRHRQDRGVLAVLDPRLRTMAYGRRFLASLPPAPVTHDLADVERFFARQPSRGESADGKAQWLR